MSKGKENPEVDKNIIDTLKALGATSKEKAVSADVLITKAIAKGLAPVYPRNGFDGHPWYPRLSTMAGVGTAMQVGAHNEPHLFRVKMKPANGTRTCFCYWYDSKKRRGTDAVDAEEVKKVKDSFKKSADKTNEEMPTNQAKQNQVKNQEQMPTDQTKQNQVKNQGTSKQSVATDQEQTPKARIKVGITCSIDVPATEDEILTAVKEINGAIFDSEWMKNHPTKISKYVKITR